MDDDTKARLLSRAREILAGCRSTAFDGRTPVFAPDAAGYYSGLYWRDFCYTIEGLGDMLALEEIASALHYLLGPLTPDDAIFPKGRTRDGKFTYNWRMPGGENLCSADNPMFAVKVVSEYLARGGLHDLFSQYAGVIEKAMDGVTLSANGLVRDDVGPYVYGFYDTVFLTGEECFASLLYREAAERLAQMFEQTGDDGHAARWRESAARTRAGLEGVFLSDTGSNRQRDVWGSAYAVYSDAVGERQRKRISEWFVKNYDRCVLRGHVRHLPRPEYWKNMGPDHRPAGEYQDGGYWSVPAPWVVRAIALTDAGLAGRMREDLADALLELDFPECINEDGSLKLPGYTASAAMGLAAVLNTP